MLLVEIFKISNFKKFSVGQMKQKTYFSTIALLIFFPPHRPEAEILAHEVGKYEKITSTRSHFTHARSRSRALNRVPTRAKPAFHPDVFFVKRRYFSFRSFNGLQEK